MVKKARPAWQAGKLNGLGGRVEEGETPVDAMVREFREESGIHTKPKDWKLFAIMQQLGGDSHSHRPGEKGWQVHVFAAEGIIPGGRENPDPTEMLWDVKLDTIGLLPCENGDAELVDSCEWLIPMALQFLRNGRPGFSIINYPAR